MILRNHLLQQRLLLLFLPYAKQFKRKIAGGSVCPLTALSSRWKLDVQPPTNLALAFFLLPLFTPPPQPSQLMHSHQYMVWQLLGVVPAFSMAQRPRKGLSLSTESHQSRSHPTSTPAACPRHVSSVRGPGACRFQKGQHQGKIPGTTHGLGLRKDQGLFRKEMCS